MARFSVRRSQFDDLQKSICRVFEANTLHLLLLVGIVVLLLVDPIRADDASVRELFASDYRPVANRIVENYSNISYKGRHTYHFPKGQKSTSSFEGKFTSDSFVVLSPTNADNNQALYSVQGRNRLYSFSLNKQSDGQSTLLKMAMHSQNDSASLSKALCLLTVPFADYLRGQTFLQLVDNKELMFLSYVDSIWNKLPAKELKIQYTFRSQSPASKDTSSVVAYYFYPELGWLCCGKRTELVGRGIIREQFYTYEATGGNGMPALKRIEEREKNTKEPDKSRLVSEVDITEFERSPPFAESEFTLTAFGLPEPPGVTWKKPRSRTWLWLLLGAAGAGVLAIVFRRLKHRHVMARTK